MSGKQKRMAETAGDREMAGSRRVNGQNGHNHPSPLLSWYLSEPRAKGLTYVLTANGYVILPTDLSWLRKGLDTSELMM